MEIVNPEWAICLFDSKICFNRLKFPKPFAVVYDGQFLAYSTERLFKTVQGMVSEL